MIRLPNAKQVYNELIKHKIIVRDRSSLPGCAGCLRITVGKEEENKILIKTLREIKQD